MFVSNASKFLLSKIGLMRQFFACGQRRGDIGTVQFYDFFGMPVPARALLVDDSDGLKGGQRRLLLVGL